MQPITAATIRAVSQSPFAEQGFPAGADPDPLDLLIVPMAQAWILDVTGWETLDAVPPGKEPLILMAVKLAVEMTAAQSTPEYLETLGDFDLIQSFSAGSYSETRRSPDEALKAHMIAAWPPLNAAIVNAMTDDAREEYLLLLQGKPIPGVEVTEVDWSRGTYGDLWGYHDPAHAWAKEW